MLGFGLHMQVQRRCFPILSAQLLGGLASSAGLLGTGLAGSLETLALNNYVSSSSQQLDRYIGDLQRGLTIIIVAGGQTKLSKVDQG